mgnify:CR=1 FL=1
MQLGDIVRTMCIQCPHKGCCKLGNFPDSTRLAVCGEVLLGCLCMFSGGVVGSPICLCMFGGRFVHSPTRLWIVGRCCGQPCSLSDTFVDCWEVLWLCGVDMLFV